MFKDMRLFILLTILIISTYGQIQEQTTIKQTLQKSKQMRMTQLHSPLLTFKASDQYQVKVLKKYKRDMLFFVEGLSFISKNILLESTGLTNQTEIHFLNLDDMSVTNSYTFEGDIFGEGSIMIQDPQTKQNIVYMMTYRNRFVYKLDEQLTEIIGIYNMPKEMREGWGMTKLDEDTILATDGSNKLFKIDPSNFTVKEKIEVKYNGQNVESLNEVELINGVIYANIFLENSIFMINPDSGEVIDKLNFNPLIKFLESEPGYQGYTRGSNRDNCLNGIAYNPETGQSLITGKNWPYIYDITIEKIE